MPITESPHVVTRLNQPIDHGRVLVIGAEPGIPGVLAVSWSQFVDQEINIADYTFVVVVSETAQDTPTPQVVATAEALLKARYPRFLKGPATELVFIGRHTAPGNFVGDLGLGIVVTLEHGVNLTDIDDEFGPYLSEVGAYEWIIELAETKQPVTWSPLVKASSRDVVGIAIDGGNANSRLVWLPAPTSVSIDEGVHTLLTTTYSLSVGPEEEPEWLASITLPNEEQLLMDRQANEEALAPLLEEASRIDGDLAEARRFLGALYETGDVLEGLVRDLADNWVARYSIRTAPTPTTAQEKAQEVET